MDKAFQAAFELGGNGDAETSVPDGHFGIVFGDAVLLGGVQQFADTAVGLARNAVDFAFDASQFIRRVVAQLPFGVQYLIDGLQQVFLGHNILTDGPQTWKFVVLVPDFEIHEHLDNHVDEGTQSRQLIQFDIGAVNVEAREHRPQVEIVLGGEGVFQQQNLLEFLRFLQLLINQLEGV